LSESLNRLIAKRAREKREEERARENHLKA
jgi:hypothetical protein